MLHGLVVLAACMLYIGTTLYFWSVVLGCKKIEASLRKEVDFWRDHDRWACDQWKALAARHREFVGKMEDVLNEER